MGSGAHVLVREDLGVKRREDGSAEGTASCTHTVRAFPGCATCARVRIAQLAVEVAVLLDAQLGAYLIRAGREGKSVTPYNARYSHAICGSFTAGHA